MFRIPITALIVLVLCTPGNAEQSKDSFPRAAEEQVAFFLFGIEDGTTTDDIIYKLISQNTLIFEAVPTEFLQKNTRMKAQVRFTQANECKFYINLNLSGVFDGRAVATKTEQWFDFSDVTGPIKLSPVYGGKHVINFDNVETSCVEFENFDQKNCTGRSVFNHANPDRIKAAYESFRKNTCKTK